jgi:hypothetical protein
MAGVWEFVAFLVATRRGLGWLVVGLAGLSLAFALVSLVQV